MKSAEITSCPQQIGDVITECINQSNDPLWAGLRAYRARKGGRS